jgi:hypothetical protein
MDSLNSLRVTFRNFGGLLKICRERSGIFDTQYDCRLPSARQEYGSTANENGGARGRTDHHDPARLPLRYWQRLLEQNCDEHQGGCEHTRDKKSYWPGHFCLSFGRRGGMVSLITLICQAAGISDHRNLPGR